MDSPNGVQMVLNENSEFLILSRREDGKGFTRILRLANREVWVKTMGGPKPLEIETPLATAAVKETEFDTKVLPDDQTTLTVVEGNCGIWHCVRNLPDKNFHNQLWDSQKKCTKPAPVDVAPDVAWIQGIQP